jgi:Family of unknown function (DUF6176)
MERTVMVFPVRQGATQDELEAIARMFKDRPDEYKESRRNLGMSLERAYHQATPMGDFVVAYIESDANAAETVGKMVASEHQLDKDFIRMSKEIHGVDLTQPPPGPPPETIGVWTDPDVATRRSGLAFCAPALPQAEQTGRALIHEAFDTRKDEMTASRRALGDNVEVVTLQWSPEGPVIGVYIEGNDPAQANRDFAASTAPFDSWFKEELKTVVPPEIDFGQPVPGIREIFDSTKI